MTDRSLEPADHLTFSQRYGYESLPQPMKMEELSHNLRREIWNVIRDNLLKNRKLGSQNYYFPQDFKRFIERTLGKLLKKPEDEISTNYNEVLSLFKKIILQRKFDLLLSLIELIVNDNSCRSEFRQKVAVLFNSHAAAYRLEISQTPYHFLPRSSMEQGKAVQNALKTIDEGNMSGASVHLRKAVDHINTQQYADSISNSILAVESVARTIDPKAEKTLTPALKSLEKVGMINHPALKDAFSKLYGYTNDEQGIRHALLDKDSPEVGLDEAIFMFGACASFAAYLVNKHQQMKQQDGN